MKVLYYNWTPLDINNLGGGVAVYIKNVLQYLADDPAKYGIEPVFLSSGFYYDKSLSPYIRQDEDFRGCKVFTIVNSPVIAPMSDASCDFSRVIDDTITVRLLDEVLQNEGPFDVIHFQSLEVLSPRVLSLKGKYPSIKFIHSIHDYGIFCANVRFWTKEGKNCFAENAEHDCGKCMKDFYSRCTRKTDRPSCKTENDKKSFSYRLANKVFRYYLKLKYRLYTPSNKPYHDYRALCVNMINNYSDAELCVSNRVAEIAQSNGIKPSKTIVDYIGTKVAENPTKCCKTDRNSPIFTLLYMGYAVTEKGFFNYLSVLETIGEEARFIDLKFASKISDALTLNRVMKLKEKFHDVILYDGYSHAEFPIILENVNLGIVPPIWEDNLPQVTIEMIANGVPVLTSSCGGAHELNSHHAFCFTSQLDFRSKIINIFNNRNLLEEYWKYSKDLTTMDMHVHNLYNLYCR